MTINSEEKKNEATAEFLNSTDLVTLAQPIPIFFPDKATADSAELDSSSTETNKVFSTDVPIMMNTDITPPLPFTVDLQRSKIDRHQSPVRSAYALK